MRRARIKNLLEKMRNRLPFEQQLVRFRGQCGAVMVVAIAFVAVFLILGAALYMLTTSQIKATELERTEVKAFNVAEAGIDAGLLALRLNWPAHEPASEEDTIGVDAEQLKQTLQEAVPSLWDPTRSDPSEFLQVKIYDNVDKEGTTTSVAYPSAPKWDSNGDNQMFVDASSNVDDDRHRIIVLAERQRLDLGLGGYALLAGKIRFNAQGQGGGQKIRINIDQDGQEGVTADVTCGGVIDQHGNDEPDWGKAIELNSDGLELNTYFPGVDHLITDVLKGDLMRAAQAMGSYFEGSDAATQAEDYMESGNADGKIVYVKSDGNVALTLRPSQGNDNQIGSVSEPVVLVIDAPDGSTHQLYDQGGNIRFNGVVIVLGDTTLRGTCSIHGALYCTGTLDNNGVGADDEIYYNQSIIDRINRQYTLGVSTVPNTWEEYTLPRE